MIRPWEQTLQSVLSGLPPSSRCECLSQHGWRHLHFFFLVLAPLLASSHLVGYGVALTPPSSHSINPRLLPSTTTTTTSFLHANTRGTRHLMTTSTHDHSSTTTSQTCHHDYQAAPPPPPPSRTNNVGISSCIILLTMFETIGLVYHPTITHHDYPPRTHTHHIINQQTWQEI